jgi:predicted Fe-Mo cluster-binding NifX family protein
MKVAIACTENHLKSLVETHFGRSDWYCIFDTKNNSHTIIENPSRRNPEMAGCDAADYLIANGVEMVIAGRFGSKVSDVFRENNVQMIIPQVEITINKLISKINKQ